MLEGFSKHQIYYSIVPYVADKSELFVCLSDRSLCDLCFEALVIFSLISAINLIKIISAIILALPLAIVRPYLFNIIYVSLKNGSCLVFRVTLQCCQTYLKRNPFLNLSSRKQIIKHFIASGKNATGHILQGFLSS